MERSERLYELAEESFKIISKAMMDEISNKK
jgi:ribonuclease-3 family protein